MKHTSRNILLTLLLVLSITLTACGSTAPTVAPATEAPVATEAPATEAPTPAPVVPPANPNIILATTTSTQDSGLLDALVPMFEAQTGYTVQTVAVGTGAALNVYGNRQQARQADRAAGFEDRAWQAAQEESRQQRIEEQKRWDAQYGPEGFEAKRFAAENEQRIRDREIQDYNQRMTEAAEARRAPYRAASQAALGRLGDMLGLRFDTPFTSGAPSGTPTMGGPPGGASPWSMDGRTPTNLPPGSMTFSDSPQSRLMASPMLNGPSQTPRPIGTSPLMDPNDREDGPFDATQPGYQPVNPMTAGQLLNLRPRRVAMSRGY